MEKHVEKITETHFYGIFTDWFCSILLLFLLSISFYFYFPIFDKIYWQLFVSILVCERICFKSEYVCTPTPVPKVKSEWIDGKFCFDKFLNFRIMFEFNWELFFSSKILICRKKRTRHHFATNLKRPSRPFLKNLKCWYIL